MKKDFLFIIFVFAVGIVAVMYTRQGDDNILFQSESEGGAGSIDSNPNYAINYKKTKKAPSSSYDNITKSVDTLAKFKQTYSEESLIRESNDSTVDEEEEKKNKPPKEVHWTELFDQWKLLVIDSVTFETNMMDVVSENKCEMTITFRDKSNFNVSNVRHLKVMNKDEQILMFIGTEKATLDNFRNQSGILEATETLIAYCDSQI